jgi:biotin transport system substrate-specific component
LKDLAPSRENTKKVLGAGCQVPARENLSRLFPTPYSLSPSPSEATLRSTITSAIKTRVEPRSIFLTVGFTAATILAARLIVPLPFSPVPVTLQTMAAILAGMFLGKKLGAVSQAQYLLLGLAGAPVFANAPFGGPGALLSPSFGYIPGMIAAAYLSGWAWEKSGKKGLKSAATSAALGASAMYLIGVPWLTCWLMVTTGQSAAVCAGHAWLVGFVPFIGADALKVAASAAMVTARKTR